MRRLRLIHRAARPARKSAAATSTPRRCAAPAAGGQRFAALDFETADHGRDSACAVAVVVVNGTDIVERHQSLLRPPRRRFLFTQIHGIRWPDVADAPTFGEHWPTLAKLFRGVDFLAAHNAPFDQGVLSACCGAAGIRPPRLPFVCTVRLARKTWGIYPTRLPNVCSQLGIPLDHHQALSDALGCARIVIEARRAGASV